MPFVVGAAAVLVTYLLLRDRMPQSMAIHAGPGGPDGYSSTGSAVASYVVVFLVEAVLFLFKAWPDDEDEAMPGAMRTLAAVAWAVAAATVYLMCALLTAATHSPDGRNVTVPVYQFVIALALGAAIVLAVCILFRRNR
ncbi:hypothetical protein [Streptomyces griseorubiginosus]|uniref:hypothetical protein n=1 Tax=Streptomyces griseorubiginosus TaxID=67304 RepID=UPI001AD6BC85|nr:hypothetical protein [Streptomyces griseorubiginosus]MBO4257215.1 hypothetical protein [Streptomyces griseorubiginosus]